MIITFGRSEKGLLLILKCQANLMITLKGVQETHSRVSISGIHQLIYLRYREWILQASSVEVGKIDTNSIFSIFLFHHHCIWQLLEKEHLPNGPRLLQFSTSSFMTSSCGFVHLLGFFFFDGTKESTFSLCVIKAKSTPGTSHRFHANTFKFYTSDMRTSTWSSTHKLYPI